MDLLLAYLCFAKVFEFLEDLRSAGAFCFERRGVLNRVFGSNVAAALLAAFEQLGPSLGGSVFIFLEGITLVLPR